MKFSCPHYNMKLTDLEPQLLRLTGRTINPTNTLIDAQGVRFLCPTCIDNPHLIVCWFADRGVPPDAMPGPGRWRVSGYDVVDITITPSIRSSACGWQGLVTDGEVN